jgi:hypothetical protein
VQQYTYALDPSKRWISSCGPPPWRRLIVEMIHRSIAWFCVTFCLAFASVANAAKGHHAPPPEPPPKAAAEANEQLDKVLDPVPSLKAAEQLYLDAQFAQSILTLDKLLRTDINDDQRKQAEFYTALNFLALGNEQRATAAFQELLDLDPEFQLPTFTSPSVRSFYARVKSTYKIIPAITHTPPSTLDASQGARIQVALKRMRKGYEPKLFFRAQGTPYFSNVDLVKGSGDTYVATLPSALLLKPESYTLEYFVVVTEGTDTPIAQLRNPQSPFSVAVSVPSSLESKPVVKRWWFWTIIGGAVAVAGGTVAAILLTRPQANPYGDANVVFRF